jgi:hypothetical protein
MSENSDFSNVEEFDEEFVEKNPMVVKSHKNFMLRKSEYCKALLCD